MTAVVALVAGLVLVIVGADVVVREGTALATRLGIHPIVVGMTVVSLGTSLPELAIGLNAATQGNGGLAVGNIVGTNLVNILLILGLAALMRPVEFEPRTLRFDLPAMIGAALLLLAVSLDGSLSTRDGWWLCLYGLAYLAAVMLTSIRESRAALADPNTALTNPPAGTRPAGLNQRAALADPDAAPDHPADPRQPPAPDLRPPLSGADTALDRPSDSGSAAGDRPSAALSGRNAASEPAGEGGGSSGRELTATSSGPEPALDPEDREDPDAASDRAGRRRRTVGYGSSAVLSDGDAARGPARDGRRSAVRLLLLLVGLAVIVGGAELLVDGAVRIARSLGVGDVFIGLTIIAIGTSAPELVTTVVSTVRGNRSVALGNLLGSSVFNIALILGPTVLVAPGALPVPDEVLAVDLILMAAAALICIPAFVTHRRLSRPEGGLFVATYVVYLAWLLNARL